MQTNANVTFNTHKAVKALINSGFDEERAEAVVEVIDKAVNETVATKADLEVMAAKMTANMATNMATKDDIKDMATKADLEGEIASLETRMMRVILIQTMIIVGLFIPVFGMLATVVVKLL